MEKDWKYYNKHYKEINDKRKLSEAYWRDYNFVIKCINSCKTINQTSSLYSLVDNFYDKWHDIVSFSTLISCNSKQLDLICQQVEKVMNHE